MTVRAISAEHAWQETQSSGRPILDLRTRAERLRFGRPPGSVKGSLLWHALVPNREAISHCQHAVRSKLPASRGARAAIDTATATHVTASSCATLATR